MRGVGVGIAMCWAGAAMAQDGLTNAHLAGSTIAKACMFNTLDIAGEFNTAVETIKLAHIVPTTVTDDAAIFMDPSGANLILNRKVDSLSCAFIVPPNVATHAFFEIIETHVGYAFGGTHPAFQEQVSDNPSPHIDGHDWVASFPGQMHHAISLQWTTDGGMILSVGFQQLYE